MAALPSEYLEREYVLAALRPAEHHYCRLADQVVAEAEKAAGPLNGPTTTIRQNLTFVAAERYIDGDGHIPVLLPVKSAMLARQSTSPSSQSLTPSP
jgi:hypothetical protein